MKLYEDTKKKRNRRIAEITSAQIVSNELHADGNKK